MNIIYIGSGIVFFIQREYQCHLYADKDQGVTIIKIVVNSAPADYFEFPLDIDFLCGKLNTGFKFALSYCTRQKMEENISTDRSTFTYSSMYMFEGVGGQGCNSIQFYKIVFQLSNAIKWGEISGYSIGKSYELTENKNCATVLYENDTVSVKYNVYRDELPVHDSELLKEQIVLKQHGNIEIVYRESKFINEFESVFTKIKRLIELSTLETLYIKQLIGWSAECYVEYGEEKHERAINIISYLQRHDEKAYGSDAQSWSWITLSELKKNNSFAIYLSKYQLLEPIIELHVEIVKFSEISDVRVFLNTVQALETYHSRFITNDVDEFKIRVEQVILKGIPENQKQSYITFLMAGTKKFITLDSRLADLFYPNSNIIFDTGDVELINFPSVIARTRNYYIHYDERIKDKGRILNDVEIPIYNHALLYILEYYLLLELGFTNISEIQEKLNRRWRNTSLALSIMKKSSQLKQGMLNQSNQQNETKA